MSMITKLQHLVEARLAKNMATLLVLRIIDQALPIVVIPFLARTLGPEGFGLVALAQSLALYTIVTTQYGFELSGTRAVARERQEIRSLAELISNIVATQLLLSLIMVIGSIVLVSHMPDFDNQPALIASALAYGVAQGLYPLWYFTGRERVAVIATIGIAAKILATVAIVALVDQSGDEWIVLACYAVCIGAASLAGFLLIAREMRFVRPSLKAICATLKFGGTLFLTRIATMMTAAGNTLLIGVLLAPAQVAVFAAGEKLCRPVAWLVQPINMVLMARLAHLFSHAPDQARTIAVLSTLILSAIGIAAGGALWIMAPLVVVLFFGETEGFQDVTSIMRIMAMIVPLMITNNALVNQWIVPKGRDRTLTTVVVLGAILNVILVILIAPSYGPTGVAWVTIIAAGFTLTGLLLSVLGVSPSIFGKNRGIFGRMQSETAASGERSKGLA